MPVTIDYGDSETHLSTWDSHITYLHLPGGMKSEIREKAREEAHDFMKQFEPEFYDNLDRNRRFSFDEIELIEHHPPNNPNETHDPHDGLLEARIKNRDELDEFIIELCEEYWIKEYISSIKREINSLCDSTNLANREFVAFVLSENPNITWSRAADLMGIAEGTFSGKMGSKVKPKIEIAQSTVEITEKIQSH